MADTGQKAPGTPRSTPPIPAPLAPFLMMAFWMLLGGAAGIKLALSTWQLLGWSTGDVTVGVPVGGGVGALAGALLGLISNPHLLVLLMAMFAGASAGAVAGRVTWGETGEIGGQAAGALLGGIAWATWLFFERRKGPNRQGPPEHAP
jgi:hypothetical protein